MPCSRPASAASGSRSTIHGKPAGIQKRYEGISAIELGNKITKAVQELEDKRVATVKHPLYPSAIDSLPCIIGSFQAGNYPSAFPAIAACSRAASARCRARTTRASSRAWSTRSPRAAAKDPWMKDHPPVVRFVGYDAQASEIPRDHPIVKTVSNTYTGDHRQGRR